MVTLFKKLDADLSTVLLDLNNASGIYLVGNVDLGAPVADAKWITGDPYPDAAQAAVHHGVIASRFRLGVAKQASMDALMSTVQSLATQLNAPGSYLWQPNGASAPKYFDAFRCDLPSAFRDDGDLHNYLLVRLREPLGIPVVLWRLPYLYGALVSSSATVVVNDPSSGTNKRLFTLTASGNMPTRANVKIAPEAGATLLQARVARRSHGDATGFTANWFQRAAGGGIGGASANFTDAAATSGTALNLSAGNADIFTRRRRWAVSPGAPSGFEGTFRVYGRFKCNGTGANTYHVQLRWAAGNVDPAGFTNDVITLTYPSGQAAYYGMIDLGTVTVDTGLGTTYGLALEVYANRTNGTDDLILDYVSLMPTAGAVGDQMATLAVRGFRDEFGQGRVAWTGDQLIQGSNFDTANMGTLKDGGIDGNVYVLRVSDDAAGSPPAAGISLANGRYTLSASVVVTRGGPAAKVHHIGNLYAWNMTNDIMLASREIGFTTDRPSKRAYTQKLTFDITAGPKNVLFFVKNLVDAAAIRIKRLSYAQQPVLGVGTEMNFNGEYGLIAANPTAYVTASGVYSQPLTQEGAFMDLQPGSNILIFDWGDQPPQEADAIDDREPIAQSSLGRNCTVTVSYYPRYSN